MNSLIIENSIALDAPKTTVWDALTNPKQTRQYMYNCEAISDWQPGSPLIWRYQDEAGNEQIAVEGHIVAIEPERYLAYTAVDPHATIDAASAQPITITYTLTTENGQTILTVTQGDYAKVTDGERRYEEAYNNGEGWNPLLQQIKALVEAP